MTPHRLRPLAWLATLGALGSSAVLVAACSGKVSNGTIKSTSQPVSVGDVSGTPAPCPDGSAHPNVCCTSGSGQATACSTYPGAPFTQCSDGATTYPDPRTCCPLDGNGNCAAPPPPPPDDAGTGPGGACVYACPVGWYSPPGPTPTPNGGGSGDGITCCETNPDGSGQCMGGGGSSGSGCTCGCPSCDPDSGVCPPCPPCNCPSEPPPPTPSCSACPPGWQVPEGDPLLCCQTASDGIISCFSQGVPPPPPDALDAGPAPTIDAEPSPPSSCFGGGGGSPDGATFTQCGCSETVNGTDYMVLCTDPGATCTCTTWSNGGGPTVSEPPTGCNDVNALFAACGFPN